MKMKSILLMLTIGCLAFYSCDDDDNINVSSEYESGLNSLYPDAQRVQWERERGYYVAEFWRSGLSAEAEAWFGDNAEWKVTVTEIPFNSFPQEVKDAHQSGEYSTWRIDDTDMVERNDMEVIYVIEVEKNGQEYDLYYAADGTLIKSRPDSDGNSAWNYIPQELTSSISEFIALKYANARIIDIEKESDGIEVDIVDGNTHREVLFTIEGEWKYTKTEVALSAVPDIVKETLNASQYAGYRIDDIDLYDTLYNDYYIFELDAEPNDIYFKVYADGSVDS